MLRGMQGVKDGRLLALGRVLDEPVIDLFPYMGGQTLRRTLGMFGCHRSISPKTISMVLITATTSASMCPLTISSMAARWANPGARILSR